MLPARDLAEPTLGEGPAFQQRTNTSWRSTRSQPAVSRRLFRRFDFNEPGRIVETPEQELLGFSVLPLLQAIENFAVAWNLFRVALEDQIEHAFAFGEQRVQHLPIAKRAEWADENVECLAFDQFGEEFGNLGPVVFRERFECGSTQEFVLGVRLFQHERQAILVFAEAGNGGGFYVGRAVFQRRLAMLDGAGGIELMHYRQPACVVFLALEVQV